MPVTTHTHTQGEKNSSCHVFRDIGVLRETRAKLTRTHQFSLSWGQLLLLVRGILLVEVNRTREGQSSYRGVRWVSCTEVNKIMKWCTVLNDSGRSVCVQWIIYFQALTCAKAQLNVTVGVGSTVGIMVGSILDDCGRSTDCVLPLPLNHYYGVCVTSQIKLQC